MLFRALYVLLMGISRGALKVDVIAWNIWLKLVTLEAFADEHAVEPVTPWLSE